MPLTRDMGGANRRTVPLVRRTKGWFPEAASDGVCGKYGAQTRRQDSQQAAKGRMFSRGRVGRGL